MKQNIAVISIVVSLLAGIAIGAVCRTSQDSGKKQQRKGKTEQVSKAVRAEKPVRAEMSERGEKGNRPEKGERNQRERNGGQRPNRPANNRTNAVPVQ